MRKDGSYGMGNTLNPSQGPSSSRSPGGSHWLSRRMREIHVCTHHARRASENAPGRAPAQPFPPAERLYEPRGKESIGRPWAPATAPSTVWVLRLQGRPMLLPAAACFWLRPHFIYVSHLDRLHFYVPAYISVGRGLPWVVLICARRLVERVHVQRVWRSEHPAWVAGPGAVSTREQSRVCPCAPGFWAAPVCARVCVYPSGHGVMLFVPVPHALWVSAVGHSVSRRCLSRSRSRCGPFAAIASVSRTAPQPLAPPWGAVIPSPSTPFFFKRVTCT